jgi:hypothetical protein
MALERQYEFGAGNGSGAKGYAFGSPVNFSQIFDGAPQFYPGSVITVQEILTIISQVIPGEEHLVDFDKRWFEPKIYLGTYQLTAIAEAPLGNEASGDQGFLTRNAQSIKRYSTYTVVANSNAPVAAGDVFTVDNCNFAMAEVSFEIAGVSVTGSKPISDTAMFQGTISRQGAPLEDREYFQLLNNVGLYFYPGCEGVLLNHRISVINTIATNYNNYPAYTCSPLGG